MWKNNLKSIGPCPISTSNAPCLGGERQVCFAPHAVEAVVDDLVGLVDLGEVAMVVGSGVLDNVGMLQYHNM